MANAQQWLDKNYPIEKRKDVKVIGEDGTKDFIEIKEGILNLNSFNNLTELYFPFAEINYDSVKYFPISLEKLQLARNNIKDKTLDNFSHLINLKWLDIGSKEKLVILNDFIGKFARNLHNSIIPSSLNNWVGSLKPLENLTKLEFICLATTDVNEGLEYLSNTVKYIGCDSDFDDRKCLKLKKILEEFNYNIELYKMTKFGFNISRIKEIFIEMENDSELSDKKRNNLPVLKLKMLDFIISQSIVDNNNYSSQIIELNNQIAEYEEARRSALAQINISRLGIQDIRGLTIEDLRNKLTEENQNSSFLLSEIELKTSENNKLNMKINECAKFIEDKELEIKQLESWKKSNLSKLNNFEEIKVSLENKNKENDQLLKALKEITNKYNWEWRLNMGTLFVNSSAGKYAIREVNKLPFIQISDTMLENLNLAVFVGKGAGYPKIQYWFIILFISFSTITYTLKIIKFSYFKSLDIFRWINGQKKDLEALKKEELQTWKDKWNVAKNYSKDDLEKVKSDKEILDIPSSENKKFK